MRARARRLRAAWQFAGAALVLGVLLLGCRGRERELERLIADRRAEIEQTRLELEQTRAEVETAKRRPRGAAAAPSSARLAALSGLSVTLERLGYGQNGYTCSYSFYAVNWIQHPVVLTDGVIVFTSGDEKEVQRRRLDGATLEPGESRHISSSFQISRSDAEAMGTAEVTFYTTHGPISTSAATPSPE
jgi:hypothetical protein